MARLPRFNLADIPQHIVQVGHNNLECFFDEEDYEFYLHSLKLAADQYQAEVHAYVLLPNTVQIIATPRTSHAIPSMMQSLGRRYVQYANHKYKRSGTLWGGRYKSSLIDSEAYLLSCYRYIELKPMFLNLVDELNEYPWSSFKHNAGIKRNHLIQEHRIYQKLGETKADRSAQYRSLFRHDFDRRLLNYIAETVKVGQVLGGDVFKDRIERIANHRVRPMKRGRPKKDVSKKIDDFSLDELVNN